MGSPSLLVWQPPPKPAHNVLPAVGPAILAPVALSNTAKDVFTHWTYWFRPTAPLVSGGALVTVKPNDAFPKPSKPRFTVGASAAAGAKTADCIAASPVAACCGDPRPGGKGIRRTGSASCFTCPVALPLP